MKTTTIEVKISEIKIGDRFRRDMGDLEGLAVSIATEGLLQPIGITEDNLLVFGERRLLAVHQETRLEQRHIERLAVVSD